MNPALLRWAREAAGYSIEDAAAKAKLAADKLRAWELGQGFPSLPQARTLAAAYHRSLAVFYLPEPPAEPAPPTDYRRSRLGDADAALSPAARWQLRLHQALREAALDLAEEAPDRFPPFPVRATLSEPAQPVGDRLRSALGVPLDEQLRWHDADRTFKEWRTAIERQGCFVFLVERLTPQDLEGFSLAFDRAPVIGVNSHKTLRPARPFTLLHELAHVALRTGGVCALNPNGGQVEAFCNRVATDLLMPEFPFRQSISELGVALAPNTWSDADIQNLAARFSVSMKAAYVRLVTFGYAKQADYDQWAAERDRNRVASTAVEETDKEGGADFFNIYLNRMSRGYVRCVFDAYHSDRLSLNELSDHLGVKPRTAIALEGRLLKQRVS